MMNSNRTSGGGLSSFAATFAVTVLLALFCAAFNAVTVMADQPADRATLLAQAAGDANPKSREVDSAEKSELTEEDEELLRKFVEQHQPKLLKLLDFMKRKQPTQYEQALRELSKSKLRLSNLEKRDVELYQIELKLWQLRSQLRMLVAEIAVAENQSKDKLRVRLADLVGQEVDLDAARIDLEQRRAIQRAEQLQSQLQERTADRDATITKALKVWENRVAKQSPRTKPTKTPK